MTGVRELAADFWAWRTRQQPQTPDDIPRVERPRGWTPDFSAGAVARYRAELAVFDRRWAALGPSISLVPDAVDHRLIGSAIARVRWELDVVRSWEHDPVFYLDQSVGVVFGLLAKRPLLAEDLDDACAALAATPRILADGRSNLTGTGYREFAALAAAQLDSIDVDLQTVLRELSGIDLPGWGSDAKDRLARSAESAIAALLDYRSWLQAEGPRFAPSEPVGRAAFEWFLRAVALVPLSVDDLTLIGRIEADRALFAETAQRRSNGTAPGTPLPSRFATSADQSAAQAEAERQVSAFYVDSGLLSQPEFLRPYNTHPFPAYLAPIGWAGCGDDLTGPSRLEQDGSAYFPDPAGELPYFYAANAHDPRCGIVHEGVHYQQLTISWRHPRPVRRWYYDSCANEGIAFYTEEMALAHGLFDDEPRSREVICNFMRLRAQRVIVDVKLATGQFDIPQAAAFLEREVPMDAETAAEEAAFFASTPGQAMTYQVGKTQLLRLLADARAAAEGEFDLQAFHDRVWLEGNVPFALQRWELLGDSSDLDALGDPVTTLSP